MGCKACEKKEKAVIAQGKRALARIPKQLKDMVQGYSNVLVRHPEVELVAVARMKLCDRCEHKKMGVCTLCKCPLIAKVRALDQSCPDKPPRWLPYRITI